MKLITSLMMTAIILFSTLVVAPATPKAARKRINSTGYVLNLGSQRAFNLLLQEGGLGEAPEAGQRCKEALDALRKAAEALAKMFGKSSEAFYRAARAAGLRGKLTVQAIKEWFPRTWNLLVERGAAISLLEVAEIVGVIHILVWISDDLDESIEGRISLDLQDHGVPKEQAEELANFLSDISAHEAMAMGGPAGEGATIMHYRELLREGRRCEFESRRHPNNNQNGPGKGPRQFPSLTEGFPGIGTINCGGPGYNNSGEPALPQSEPGSNGTQGTFDGGITVTGVDPCRE